MLGPGHCTPGTGIHMMGGQMDSQHRERLLQQWERFVAWWEWWRSDPMRMLKHTSLLLVVIWVIYGLQMLASSLRLGHEGPPWNPPSAAGWALWKYDTDGDGAVGPGEVDKAPGLKAALENTQNIDLDNDGKLNGDEIASRLEFYRDCRNYLLKPVRCRIIFDGQPLTGATVRFVPDWCIRSTIEMAVGDTDREGVALMSLEDSSDLGIGVRPGMYSVEVSRKDTSDNQLETVPARYNAQTTLGYEAAPDGGPGGLKPTFELTSH